MQATTIFENQKPGLWLDDIRHGVIVAKKPSDADVPTVTLTVRLEPFNCQHASAVSFDLRKTLFMLSTGEPVQHLGRTAFDLGIPQQDVLLFPSPDTHNSNRWLRRCDIKGIVARPSGGGRAWALLFHVVVASPSSAMQAYLVDQLHKQVFAEFVVTDATLPLEPVEGQEAQEREERALRVLEGELVKGAFGLERAAAVESLPLDADAEDAGAVIHRLHQDAERITQEAARRPSFRHGTTSARQHAKQGKGAKPHRRR